MCWLTDKLDDVAFGFDPSKAESLLVGVQQVHVPHVAGPHPNQDEGEGHVAVGALDQQPLGRLHVFSTDEIDKHTDRERWKGGERKNTQKRNLEWLCRFYKRFKMMAW